MTLRFVGRVAIATTALALGENDPPELDLALADANHYQGTPEHGPAVSALGHLVARCRGANAAHELVESVKSSRERDRALLAVSIFGDDPGAVALIQEVDIRCAAEMISLFAYPDSPLAAHEDRILRDAPGAMVMLCENLDFDLAQGMALLLSRKLYVTNAGEARQMADASATIAEKYKDEAALRVGGIGIALASIDPPYALTVFERAEERARSLPQVDRAYAVLHIATGLKEIDLERASDLFEEVELLLRDPEFKRSNAANLPGLLIKAGGFFVEVEDMHSADPAMKALNK